MKGFTRNPLQHFVNHIAFIIDASYSMHSRANDVARVFDGQISHLRKKSVDLNQETRVSIYLFNDDVDCLIFDQDVMRTPSIGGYYNTAGNTALMDATAKAVADMQKLPELYGDHAFLLDVLTDGEENRSKNINAQRLNAMLSGLPDNWTVACQVPHARGEREARLHGFLQGSIAIWDTIGAQGFEKGVRQTTDAIDNYMTMRSTGVRGTKSFFDLKGASKTDILGVLQQIPNDKFRVLDIASRDDGIEVRDFVEKHLGPYAPGKSYYELVKSETVQAGKQIAIQHHKSREVFTGQKARDLLGLPAHETRIRPTDYGDWRVFVQSTSYNRHLPAGSKLLTLL